MSLWNVQGPRLHSWDTLVLIILTFDYTFKVFTLLRSTFSTGNNLSGNV